jgi:hypothetical protein
MMNSSVDWNGQDPTLPGQDDFTQFFDANLGDTLQFDFQDFSPQHNQAGQLMHQNEGESMDTGMDGQLRPDTTMQEHMPAITTATSHPAIPAAPLAHGHSSTNSLVELDAQIRYLQHQRQQQQQRNIQEQQRNFYAQSRVVPPTPNSVEMRGGSAQFFSHSDPQQQAIYERFRMQVKEQEVSL